MLNIMGERKTILALALAFWPLWGLSESLDEWLKENTEVVQSYLLSLKGEDLGRKLKGVSLSDGSRALQGYTYLGSWLVPRYRALIFLFAEQDGHTRVAYVWVDGQGKPWPLPDCAPDKNRPDWFVWSGSVISGDAYTYSEVLPGGDLVITHCVAMPAAYDAHEQADTHVVAPDKGHEEGR